MNNLVSYEAFQAKVEGENINTQTLLATDYINHFNEIHMMIEMIPSMPDCLELLQDWQPKSYQQHFADSAFTAKDLAIEAYDHSPDEYRLPFEDTVAEMDDLVLQTIAEVEKFAGNNKTEQLQRLIKGYLPQMIRLIEKCGSIINGAKHLTQQQSIDNYFDEDMETLDGEDLDQSAIDDLF